MKTKILGLLAAALFGMPMISSATTVNGVGCFENAGDYSCVTSIKGLDVSGNLFDVTFVNGRPIDIYPSPLPFFNDSAAALLAAQAMIAAARNASYTDGACDTISGGPCFTNPWLFFGAAGYIDADIFYNQASIQQFDHSKVVGLYAIFTPSIAVPEPGTLALLGLGLAGLGLSRRRKAS